MSLAQSLMILEDSAQRNGNGPLSISLTFFERKVLRFRRRMLSHKPTTYSVWYLVNHTYSPVLLYAASQIIFTVLQDTTSQLCHLPLVLVRHFVRRHCFLRQEPVIQCSESAGRNQPNTLRGLIASLGSYKLTEA